MNTYETMIALNPNLEKEGLGALLDGFKEVIARRGGMITVEKELGKKKFAYTVKKYSTGYYHLIYFNAPPETVFELERSYKHAEDVLKFITLRLDEKELKHSMSINEAPPTPTPAPTAVPVKEKEEE
jgi:small subunit ribosomal protein S6